MNKSLKLINNINKKSLIFDVNEKEKILLSGPSGSGKSLSAQVMAGINLDKKININKTTDEFEKGSKGYSAQGFWSLGLSLEKEVSCFDYSKPIDKKEIVKACYSACIINSLDLKEIKKHKWNLNGTKNLSGGELKRLSIARVLYRNPDLIILDEPTASIQQDLKQTMVNRIISIYASSTIIFISHDTYSKNTFDKVITWK